MAEDNEKSTDLEREIKKALRIAYEVRRWEWLSGITPMTPPMVPVPSTPKQATTPVPLNTFTHSGRWIVAEARRMQAAAEIPDNITKTTFARALAERMQKAFEADRSIRPMKWRSIRNQLEPWGLWPIASI